MNKKDISVI